MTDVLLGLDVGTTATKALAFDPEGQVVGSAVHKYDLLTPKPGWVEQNPQDLWHGVVETTKSVLKQLEPGSRIVALSQSSQGGTTIPVGDDGQPVYNAISWMDERATTQIEPVRRSWGVNGIYQKTGWPLQGGLPLQHIDWLRRNQPDVFKATRYFLFVNDYITYRLTGKLCMNPSDAGITQLMDLATGDWDEQLLDWVGIHAEKLSPIHISGDLIGPVTAAAREETGLPPGTQVVNGAHDQYCAAVGAGVTDPGDILLSCGTAWVVLGVTRRLENALSSGMSVSHHAVKRRWGVLRSMGGVGTSLEWFLTNVWEKPRSGTGSESAYADINSAVTRSPVGANGLLFYPLTGGHKLSHRGGGGFVGLVLSHSRDDMARAVMEGVALELRWTLNEIRKAGIKVTQLKMVGGATESPLWPQIVADVTGVPVSLPAVKQAASYGAAILAGVGIGLFDDPEKGFRAFERSESLLEPNHNKHKHYTEQFAIYQELFEALDRGLDDQSL